MKLSVGLPVWQAGSRKIGKTSNGRQVFRKQSLSNHNVDVDQITEVKDDLKTVMTKAAHEWDKWVKLYEKNPEKAAKK